MCNSQYWPLLTPSLQASPLAKPTSIILVEYPKRLAHHIPDVLCGLPKVLSPLPVESRGHHLPLDGLMLDACYTCGTSDLRLPACSNRELPRLRPDE